MTWQHHQRIRASTKRRTQSISRASSDPSSQSTIVERLSSSTCVLRRAVLGERLRINKTGRIPLYILATCLDLGAPKKIKIFDSVGTPSHLWRIPENMIL